MKNIIKYIPNTITCLNLFSGCISCILAFHGEYMLAAVFIYLAAVFDFFDGMAARILKAYSAIGKELDSLADVISFGMAPGVILFSWINTSISNNISEPSYISSLLPFIAFLIPVFSALRLAKFNTDTRQTTSFIGLPVPANAIFIASLISLHKEPYLVDILSNMWIIVILILLFSFLLVCELPMFSLKFKNLRWQDNKSQYILIFASLILLLILHLVAIPLIIILFILMSLFLWMKKK